MRNRMSTGFRQKFHVAQPLPLWHIRVMEKLAEYIKTHNAIALAAQIGAHKAQVYRWAKGESKPRVDVAIRLARVTNGAVPVEAWGE